MRRRTMTLGGWTIVLLALSLTSAGCGDNKSKEDEKPTVAPAEQQPAQPAPRPEAAPPTAKPLPKPEAKPEPRPESKPDAKPEVKLDPAKPAEPKPAAPPETAPQKRSAPEPTKRVASDVVILAGSPMGGVRLEHRLHASRARNNCASCHHPSKPEKPASVPHQACSDCHTKAATPPMKTKYQAAFHNPAAQAGTCIDCHKAENAKGKKAPVKCTECHKKENG